MSFPLRPLAFLLLWSPSRCRSRAHSRAEPTANDVKALKEKFQTEREQAAEGQVPGRHAHAGRRTREARRSRRRRTRTSRPRCGTSATPAGSSRTCRPGLPEHVTRVLGESRMRHADRVNSLSYSPDGRFVASASRDGTVKVWDLGNGREVSTYRGHVDQPDDPTKAASNVLGVTDVAFHPKEKVIASASGNQVHMWDPATGKTVKTLVNLGKTDKPIKSLAFSPDGKLLAVGADDGILRVVESDTRQGGLHQPVAQRPHREGRVQPERETGRDRRQQHAGRGVRARRQGQPARDERSGRRSGRSDGRRVQRRQRRGVHLRSRRQGAADRRPEPDRHQRPEHRDQAPRLHRPRRTGHGACGHGRRQVPRHQRRRQDRPRVGSDQREATAVVPGAHGRRRPPSRCAATASRSRRRPTTARCGCGI